MGNEVGWFLVMVVSAFVGMELLSYALHRWVFHGMLWKVHVTHHEKRHGRFEANDVFAVFFTAVAFVLMLYGFFESLLSPAFAIGLGMSVYGGLYFIVHDLITHKRYLPMSSKMGWVEFLRRAHLRHHQLVTKDGQEPYGLFLVPSSLWGELGRGGRTDERRESTQRGKE